MRVTEGVQIGEIKEEAGGREGESKR